MTALANLPTEHPPSPDDDADEQTVLRHRVAILGDEYLLSADVAEEAEGSPTPAAWTPGPDDEAKVERYMRALRYYRGETASIVADRDTELARLEGAYQAERDRIMGWAEAEARRPAGAVAFLEHALRLFMEAAGLTKHNSPNGKLSWRKGRTRIEIADPDAFCAAHAGTPFVRTKVVTEPDKKAIDGAIKSGNEIPEGADIVRGEDTFVIDLPKDL